MFNELDLIERQSDDAVLKRIDEDLAALKFIGSKTSFNTVSRRIETVNQHIKSSFIDSEWYAGVVSVVVIANTLEIGFEMDYPEYTSFYTTFDTIVMTFYLLDLFTRMLIHRWEFFKHKFNLFDTVIVLVSMIDTWILTTTAYSSLRSLRLLRFIRLANLVRLFRSIPGLWSIVEISHAILSPLLWTGFLMSVIFLSLGIFLTTIFQSSEDWLFVKRRTSSLFQYFDPAEYFGSVWRSMITLLQLTTLDKHMTSIIRPICEKFPIMYGFFVLFTFLVGLGLVSVVTGTMTTQAIENARTADSVSEHRSKLLKRKATILLKRSLQNLLKESPMSSPVSGSPKFKRILNGDSGGASAQPLTRSDDTTMRRRKRVTISQSVKESNFDLVLSDPAIHHQLKQLSLTKQDALTLQSTLNPNTNSTVTWGLTVRDFVRLLIRMKRETSAHDVTVLLMSTQAINEKLRIFLNSVDQLNQALKLLKRKLNSGLDRLGKYQLPSIARVSLVSNLVSPVEANQSAPSTAQLPTPQQQASRPSSLSYRTSIRTNIQPPNEGPSSRQSVVGVPSVSMGSMFSPIGTQETEPDHKKDEGQFDWSKLFSSNPQILPNQVPSPKNRR